MRIWIFGDSFAASNHTTAWANLLGKDYNIINQASNGSSEYRIWRNYKKFRSQIFADDYVIFCHTSNTRIYLKDEQTILSRLIASHPMCDLIFSDIFEKKENKFINILKTIWDDEYFEDTYQLMLTDLLSVPNSLHFSFFDTEVTNYQSIWLSNKGNINHMNENGNMLVYQEISKSLK